MERYDVIVIGGGHAGAEAATAAARSGVRTLLLTQNLETIGQMSCNPAIGGIAKGTVVREVDALGGIMGRATDRARLQFRMLNRSKGPAVWSPRAQCDRGLYRRAVRSLLERQPLLEFAQGTVSEFLLNGRSVCGVTTREGRKYSAGAVVLTAGTFLRGRIHMGTGTQIPAGRSGDSPSVELAEYIAGLGLTIERFKTGTPPRIDGRSVNYEGLERQDGDEEEYWFSFFEQQPHPAQLPCYITYAGEEVKEIITRHLRESALYGGAISGRGPRYCPSVEDKIVKFPAAVRHQVFLEPEGLDTTEMYVNGLSTSLPASVQLEFLQKVPGLERARMTRAGYAIEYDYFPPNQLHPTLQVRGVEGLFFAGQINGTTGYEEAAGQGVVAGLNAAASILQTEPVILQRDEAFIGVLIDDLVTRGVDEPYRLFTSRAEFRLLLRQDNALRRLLAIAERRSLLTNAELTTAHHRLDQENRMLAASWSSSLGPVEANEHILASESRPITQPCRIGDLAKRPGVPLGPLLRAAGIDGPVWAVSWAEIEIKYAGYIERERQNADRLSRMNDFALPADLPYQEFECVSYEAREKLAKVRPETLGQASRLPGLSPSDLQGLVMEVLRWRPHAATNHHS
ncbi:MAG: tRNA uridine-5-carboxymethylaminomethyl(34) synthesis enzyme MnmG [Gemmatimonadota bacterium]